jgi:hypothetical protein
MASKGEEQRAYPADKARQGEIILRTPLRRAIFIAGLVGMVILIVLWVGFTR